MIPFIKTYAIGISLVLITWLIFFFPILSGQSVYFLDDLKIIYYPIETIYANFQHSWQLPVWANEFGFGQPLLAWGQLGFFTPIHLLLRALFVPPLVLLQISVAAYFLIGSISMFVFLIRRNIHQAAAALGAVTFAYCGFNIGHLNHVNFYTSTMLLPLLLLAIDLLIQKRSLRHATTLALIAAAITVSGQPQVVLYVFSVAALIGLGLYIPRPSLKIIGWTVYAGILALLLSSFAILPLQEFVPQTERAAGLPHQELYEFSYPPYDTITLIFPYFFGGHDNYSGPKGFQELAAYVGVIPLMLAGIALCSWRSHRAERIVGIILVTFGILLALGKYSFLYTYLVENHYITTIGVVGRFVFFFDIGMVLLATLGLHDILSGKRKLASRILSTIAGILIPTLLIILPFWIYATGNADAQEQFHTLFTIRTLSWWLIVGGCVFTILISLTKNLSGKQGIVRTWILPILGAATLLFYGWNYNPRTPASQAYTPSPLLHTLQEYKENNVVPARLYAAEKLPVTGNPHTNLTLSDPISPRFSVFQKLHITRENLECITIPIQADSPEDTEVTLMIRSGFDGTIWHQQSIASEDVFKHTDQRVCFRDIPQSDKENLILSLTSSQDTNMKVFVSPSTSSDLDVYFVRVQNPTPKQLERSRKPLNVQYTAEFPRLVDKENALLVRHIQTIAGASSARWIGALSLRPYREFVDSFFANDSDAFDGDGVHALTRNKKLVDMVGITHFTQLIEYGQTNDPMITAGYKLIQEADTGESLIRLYENPDAYPKAFIVPEGQFIAADDEIRFHMRDPLFDPKSLAYISGPTPPAATTHSSIPLQASATILTYDETRVDIQTNSNKDAFLVVTDSTNSQWQTFIDDTPTLQLKANSLFKAAQIPAGQHIVSFRYISPAIERAKVCTGTGIGIILLAYGYSFWRQSKK